MLPRIIFTLEDEILFLILHQFCCPYSRDVPPERLYYMCGVVYNCLLSKTQNSLETFRPERLYMYLIIMRSAVELGTLCSELGTLCSELGTLCSELGTLCSELGTSCLELGTSCSELGSRSFLGRSTDADFRHRHSTQLLPSIPHQQLSKNCISSASRVIPRCSKPSIALMANLCTSSGLPHFFSQ